MASREHHLLGKSRAIIEKALETFAKQEMTAILLRLRQKGQQYIAQFFGHMIRAEKLQRIREINHLGH